MSVFSWKSSTPMAVAQTIDVSRRAAICPMLSTRAAIVKDPKLDRRGAGSDPAPQDERAQRRLDREPAPPGQCDERKADRAREGPGHGHSGASRTIKGSFGVRMLVLETGGQAIGWAAVRGPPYATSGTLTRHAASANPFTLNCQAPTGQRSSISPRRGR